MPQGIKKGASQSSAQSSEGFTISGKDVAEEALGTAVDVRKEPDGEGFVMPCSINGAMAGLSGGALGYVIGFGGKLVGHKGKNRFAACRREGWSTAKSFAVFGGVFAAASCIIQRLRQKQDAINGGVAGCITGLVLGWNGGPAAALQSAAMMGAFSYVIERMQGTEAIASSSSPDREQQQRRALTHEDPSVLSPAVPLMGGPCQLCTLPLPLAHLQGFMEPLRDAVCPRMPKEAGVRGAPRGTARFPRQ